MLQKGCFIQAVKLYRSSTDSGSLHSQRNCLALIEIYLLIAGEFIDICQRKGKDVFK